MKLPSSDKKNPFIKDTISQIKIKVTDTKAINEHAIFILYVNYNSLIKKRNSEVLF